MGHEGIQQTQEAVPSLEAHDLLLRFGMSEIEGAQYMSAFGHEGTVAEMLANPKCPVGAMVMAAHERGGITEVNQTFGQLNAMSAGAVNIVVAEKTEADYELAKGAKAAFDQKKTIS